MSTPGTRISQKAFEITNPWEMRLVKRRFRARGQPGHQVLVLKAKNTQDNSSNFIHNNIMKTFQSKTNL